MRMQIQHRARGRRVGALVALLFLSLAVLVPVVPGTPAVTAADRPTLRVSPASGPPGTVITLHGYVPGLTAQNLRALDGVTVCLDGCAAGFTDQGVPVRYTASGQFTARFTLPKVPVLTASGPLVLADGTYTMGFTCIGPNQMGCLSSTMAIAPFRVDGATTQEARACSAQEACASLVFSPADARPGQLVRVTGFAPLSPVIGQPFGYDLVLEQDGHAATLGAVSQTMDGRLSATFRMPALLGGIGLLSAGVTHIALEYQFNAVVPGHRTLPPGVTIERQGKTTAAGAYGYELVRLASTPFRVLGLTGWASAGVLVPKATMWSQPLPLTVRPGHPQDVAYCTPGAIRVTTNGGRSWQSVATEGAAVRSMSTAYPIAYTLKAPARHPMCSAVLWDPNSAHTFYAVFGALARKYGSMPPVFDVAYETRDGGRTWERLPVPAGFGGGSFGGMSVVGTPGAYRVQAVFGSQTVPEPYGQGASMAVHATAEETIDGGAHWRTTGLTCPSAGPCLRFGALPGALPGMGTATLDPLVTSTDGGRHWQTLAWPSGALQAQGRLPTGQAQLAWLGGARLAFVDPESTYPLRLSVDGGATWQDVRLPVPPGTAWRVRNGELPFTVLMLLGNGDLLAATAPANGDSAQWWVLRPRTGTWVRDSAIHASDATGRLVVAGGRLYGLRETSGGVVSGIVAAPLP
jgi:hypothetical protein